MQQYCLRLYGSGAPEIRHIFQTRTDALAEKHAEKRIIHLAPSGYKTAYLERSLPDGYFALMQKYDMDCTIKINRTALTESGEEIES